MATLCGATDPVLRGPDTMKYTKCLVAAASLLLAAVFLLIPLSAYYFYGCLSGFGAFAGLLAEHAAGCSLLPDPPERLQLPVTCLIFGVDAGEWVGNTYRPGPGRADTILLVRVYADRTAVLLSLPRDTLVEIPGRPGDDKINHAYAFGQAGLLVESVERFTGVSVDCYLGLNYRAFVDIVDLLGGVDFEVDRVIAAYGLRLEKGLQRLDGRAAFVVVTNRRDPLGDIDRIKRQQRFIRAVLQEAKGRPLDDLFYMMLAAWRNVDTDLSVADAVGLAGALRGIGEADVAMAVVPGCFYNRGGISYWKPDLPQTRQLIGELFDRPGAQEVTLNEPD